MVTHKNLFMVLGQANSQDGYLCAGVILVCSHWCTLHLYVFPSLPRQLGHISCQTCWHVIRFIELRVCSWFLFPGKRVKIGSPAWVLCWFYLCGLRGRRKAHLGTDEKGHLVQKYTKYRYLPLNPNMDNPNSWSIQSPMEIACRSRVCYSACVFWYSPI